MSEATTENLIRVTLPIEYKNGITRSGGEVFYWNHAEALQILDALQAELNKGTFYAEPDVNVVDFSEPEDPFEWLAAIPGFVETVEENSNPAVVKIVDDFLNLADEIRGSFRRVGDHLYDIESNAWLS